MHCIDTSCTALGVYYTAMESYTWLIVLLALILKIQCSHTVQKNYVKPYGNATCPGDPCLTLEDYTEASDTYFISDVDFIFISGDHYFNASLRLTNITNVHFQGENMAVQILFSHLANLTFITSYNIIFSNLSFTLGGSQSLGNLFATMCFQSSSVTLLNLTFLGNKGNLFSTALYCHSSHIQISDLIIVGTRSVFGAGVIVYNSTVIFSGSNIFNNNTAFKFAGALSSLESNITFSGSSYFEGNQCLVSGGAIATFSTTISISGMALFRHNKAIMFNGGAIATDDSRLTLSNGIFHFLENSANIVGGAMFIYNYSTAHISGQIFIQGNTATSGAIGLQDFSNVVCVGEVLFTDNSASFGAAVTLFSGSQMLLSGAILESNHAQLSGGAVSILTGSHMTINNSLLMHNNAGTLGGAISLSNGSLQFKGNNYIEHNMGLQSGGIDAFNLSRLNFTGSSYFRNNTSGGFGGGLSVTLTNVTIQGVLNFRNNKGLQGGAVYGISSRLNFDQFANVTFQSNEASIQGGAIYSIDTTWNMKGTVTFNNNSASVGGAMSLTGSTKLILNTFSKITYTENHADTNGGAIFFTDAISADQCREIMRLNVTFCFEPNSTTLQPVSYTHLTLPTNREV